MKIRVNKISEDSYGIWEFEVPKGYEIVRASSVGIDLRPLWGTSDTPVLSIELDEETGELSYLVPDTEGF
jgi:hypothetical protein